MNRFGIIAGVVCAAILALVSSASHAETAKTESAPAQPFPDDFQGHVTYHGTYNGSITENPDRSSFKNGTLSFTIGGGKKTKINGEIDIELEIDGPKVTLTSRATGPFSTGIEVGTRQGANCVFPEPNGAITAYCGQDAFRGQFKTNKNEDPKVEVNFDTKVTAVIDAAERERQRAAAQAAREAEAAAAKAEAERQKAEHEAWLKSLKPATPAMITLLKTALEADATNWVFNTYDANSLTDVRIMETRTDGTVVLLGKYSFNQGGEGWLKAQVRDGKVLCLEYWDSHGVCSAPRAKAEDRSGYPDILDLSKVTFSKIPEDAVNIGNRQCFSWHREKYDSNSAVYEYRGGGYAGSSYSDGYIIYVHNDCTVDTVFSDSYNLFFGNISILLKPDMYFVYQCEETTTYAANDPNDIFNMGRRSKYCTAGRTYTPEQVTGKR